MALHADHMGSGPPLVLVHGFTQTRRCWGPVAEDLAADHRLTLVDAPGHGRSHAVAADLDEGGRLLIEAGGRATYVGYSMGARLCLHAALARPADVAGLVLVGGTGGIDDAGERAVRRRSDAALAASLRAGGVDRFLDRWLAQPLFAGLDEESAFRAERAENTADGLASSLELAGTGSQRPLWAELGRLTMPVLVVTGERDAKFGALAVRLAAGVGGPVAVATISRAGHTAHLERPRAFLHVVRSWLAEHGL